MATSADLLTSITQRLSEGHSFTLDECCAHITQLRGVQYSLEYLLSVLRAFLDSGTLDVTNLDGESQMRLFRACASISLAEGDTKAFKSTIALLTELFENGFSMDKAWPFHELLRGRPANALHHVSLTLAKLLLDRGDVDPNLYHNGFVPIMAQTYIALYTSSPLERRYNMMDLLIEHGADINLPDQLPLATTGQAGEFLCGLTPLQLLCTNPALHHPALQRCTLVGKRFYCVEDVSQRHCGRANALKERFINVYKAGGGLSDSKCFAQTTGDPSDADDDG